MDGHGAARNAGDFEDLVGGRVLAWVGGLAVLVGIVLLLSIAISRGWIGETERSLIAALVSLGLLGGGVRSYGRRGRTDAALAAAAAGVAGLYTTLFVAGEEYGLIGALPAHALALAVGGVAVALAVRWEARGFAALGILGGLLAPIALGAEGAATISLLGVAYAASVAVSAARGWSWLGLPAFLAVTPQWLVWAFESGPPLVSALGAAGAFGALTACAAVGFDVRRRADALRASSHGLLALNALVVAVAGWQLAGGDAVGRGWLVALALAHVGLGVAGLRSVRLGDEAALAAIGIGVVLGNFAYAALVDGLALPLAWAIGAAAFAALTRLRGVPALDAFALLGVGGHLAVALGHAVIELDALSGGSAGLVALAAVAAGCATSARLVGSRMAPVAWVLDLVGLVTLGAVTWLAFDGLALIVAWAAQALVLVGPARLAQKREPETLLPLGTFGAVAFATAAALLALADPLVPAGLWRGAEDVLAALVAGGAVAAAVGACAWLAASSSERQTVLAVALTLALHTASVLVVSAFAGAASQLALSAFWALTGVAAVVAGLSLDRRAVRLGGLVLLGVTVAKVFRIDLATLDSEYRAASFLALGILLLLGAFAWQRIRPRPPADLREVPPALR